MQEIHKDKLKVLASDDILLKALEEFFYINISKEMPDVKDHLDDIRLGQEYRAFTKAKKIIVESIKELRSMKIVKENTKNINRAI